MSVVRATLITFFVWSVFLLLSGNAFAQTTCGNLIGEENGEPYVVPIEDCGEPFGPVNENPNLQVAYGGVTLTSGGSYEFLHSTSTFVLTGTHPDMFMSGYTVYRHEGNDYRNVGEGVIEDPFTFTSTGTYSLIIYEDAEPILSRGLLEQFLAYIVPKAHAFPGISRVITFDVMETPAEPTGASSILFLPGIQASRLFKEGLFGSVDRLWEPNINQDVFQIRMNESGESVEEIYTGEVLDEIYGTKNVYQGFMDFLTDLKTEGTIQDWEPFAYDWRYAVTDIADEGTQYETEMRDATELIANLAEDSFSGKVTLIGHSNGGLLAKALMSRLEREGKEELVDRVVFIGTPQLGTPKAIASLLHGYDQQSLLGIIISPGTVRETTRNMSGALGLVPSEKYFAVSGDAPVSFGEGEATSLFRNAYGNTITSESELLNFMTGSADGRDGNPDVLHEALTVNRSLLEDAFNDHRNLLDTWVAPDGVEVIEIVGVGLNTLKGIEYREFVERTCVPDAIGGSVCTNSKIYKPVPLFTQYGDETVVMESAEGYGSTKKTYYVNLRAILEDNRDNAVAHADLTEDTSVQSIVSNLVGATGLSTSFVSESAPSSVEDFLLFGVHSPASISLKDASGKKVERGNDRYPIEEIEGSEYLELGGSKYIVVPKNGTYEISLKGTGQGGVTFTLDALTNGEQNGVVNVFLATITPSTSVGLSYENEALTNFKIDENGDGVVDVEMTPEGEIVVTEVTYADLRTGVKNLSLSAVHKKVLLALVLVAEELHKKTLTNPRLKTLELIALKELESTLRLYVKKRLLTQSQIDSLLGIIGKLKI